MYSEMNIQPNQSGQPRLKQQSSGQPTSFEELMKLATKHQEKKKTLEEEIEEELSSKRVKNDKKRIKTKRRIVYEKFKW